MTTSEANAFRSVSKRMRIAGMNFRLDVQAERSTQQFAELWDGLFCSSETEGADNSVNVDVSLNPGASQDGDSTKPGETVLIRTTNVNVFRGEGSFRLVTSGMSSEARSDSLQIYLDDRFWQKTLFEQRDFLLVTMVAVLRLNNVFGFHGNGLVNGHTGILISGNSGAGKTTLTHSLIASGWKYLADDAITLRSVDGEVDVSALRKGFSLTEEARVRTSPPPVWDDSSIRELGNGKYLAYPTPESEQAMFVPQTRPSALLFCEVGKSEKTVIEPLPGAKALVMAIEQAAGLLTDPKSTAAQLNVLRDLVNQSKCFKVISGRDVIGSPEEAKQVSNLILEAVNHHE